MSNRYKQGIFTPKNPKKYIGDSSKIVYRSSWELKTFKWLDSDPAVISWSSEELAIPYISPIDNKTHRYFPDLIIKMLNSNGREKTYLVEIKPYAQSIEPKINKRISKRYITEICTWGINKAKWDAARQFCLQKGFEFMILTEKDAPF